MSITTISLDVTVQLINCRRRWGGHSRCGNWARLRSVGRLFAA